jgi:hypothetical protein
MQCFPLLKLTVHNKKWLWLFLGGWIHDVSFSASGDLLAFVGHDSSISVVNGANQQQ